MDNNNNNNNVQAYGHDLVCQLDS